MPTTPPSKRWLELGARPQPVGRPSGTGAAYINRPKLSSLLTQEKGPQSIDRLSIHVPVRLSELAALASQPYNDIEENGITDRITCQLQQALQAHTKIDDPQKATHPTPAPLANEMSIGSAPTAISNVIHLLAQWYQQGVLPGIVQQFSDEALHAWQRLALESLPNPQTPDDGQQDLLTEAESYCQNVLPQLKSLKKPGVRRFLLLAALLQRFPDQFSADQIIGLLDRYTPDSLAPTEPTGQEPEASRSIKQTATSILENTQNAPPQSIQRNTIRPGSLPKAPTRCIDFEVTSVLPFVAIGVLSRLGYFDVLSTALKAENTEPDIRCFVVALAYKMLPRPCHGWHRAEPDSRTASAAAGLADPIPGDEIDRFASRSVDCLSPLDAFLQVMLAQGHAPLHPLVIHQLQCVDQPLWLLMECQGCFPIGWFLSQDALLQALEGFAGNTFLISSTSAQPSLFKALTQHKHRFLTWMPPARGDNWRSVDRQRTVWTNDPDSSPHGLLNQSRHLAPASQAAQQITESLITDRPVLPQGASPPPATAGRSVPPYTLRLELSLALAAASALATVAWELWREAEPTSPTLALDRFGDLGGRVTLEHEKITVRPALGRRYQDLREHRFFVDVVRLPWLNGRRLEFVGI